MLKGKKHNLKDQNLFWGVPLHMWKIWFYKAVWLERELNVDACNNILLLAVASAAEDNKCKQEEHLVFMWG